MAYRHHVCTSMPSAAVDLPDDLWLLVLARLTSIRDLANVCFVSKRFNRLATSQELFKNRTQPVYRNRKVSDWRRAYRHQRALTAAMPKLVVVPLLMEKELTLLLTLDDGQCLFHDVTADAFLQWPDGWTLPRSSVLPGPLSGKLCSMLVGLGNNLVGILQKPRAVEGRWLLVIFDIVSGIVVRWVKLPSLGEPLSELWTADALHCRPILLRVYGSNSRIAYMTQSQDLLIVDVDADDEGVLLSRYSCRSGGFSRVVRGLRVDGRPTVFGVTEGIHDGVGIGPLRIRSVVEPKVESNRICEVRLGHEDALVDVVANVVQKGTASCQIVVACRVVNAAHVCLALFLKEEDGPWVEQREVLASLNHIWWWNGVPRASGEVELVSEGDAVLYRPEMGLPFAGSIRMWQKGRGDGACFDVYTLGYARASGRPFEWVQVCGEKKVLFAYAPQARAMTIFNLGLDGKCLGSILSQDLVRNVSVAGQHVVVVETSKCVNLYHFGTFCRELFPQCYTLLR